MKSVLITGGAGYIGSHAVNYFANKGFKVVVFDNLINGYKEPITILKNKYKNISFIKGDLLNKKDIKKAFKGNSYDCVIHFAALCSVNESVENPGLYFKNNVCGTLNLVEEMKGTNTKNIVFSSTCATYGKVKKLPVTEKSPQNPTSPYGLSKLMAEQVIKEVSKVSGINYAILRYFNVCGAEKSGLIGDSKKPSSLLMQNAVRGALNIEPFYLTYQQVNTKDKSPIRDYVNVEDLVKAHFLAYKYLITKNKSQEFNIGTGKGNSVLQIVKTVEKVLSTKLKRQKGNQRKGEDAKIYADITKATKLLKWKPTKTLKQSVLSLKNWYTKYPSGYKY